MQMLVLAPVSQLAEERGSDPRKCEFDSRQEHANHGPVVELADTAISKVAVFGRPGSSPGRATSSFLEELKSYHEDYKCQSSQELSGSTPRSGWQLERGIPVRMVTTWV